MSINLTTFDSDLQELDTDQILSLIEQCKAELAAPERTVDNEYEDEAMRGGVRPRRPSL